MMRRLILALALLWYGPAFGQATTWSSTDTSKSFTLSNGDLTAQNSAYWVGVAVDFTNNKIWLYDPIADQWNGAAIGSQDPANNVGGISISAITGAKFPTFNGYWYEGTGPTGTFNFGASPLLYMPSGFSSWNTLAGTTTMNPSDKSALVSLSNGDLTATRITTGSTHAMARGTTSLSSGKAYYEFQGTHLDGPGGSPDPGIANSSASLSNQPGSSVDGGNFDPRNYWWHNGTNTSLTSVWGDTGGDYRSVRATNARTGLRVFEATVDANASIPGGGFAFGFGKSSARLAGVALGTDTNSVGLYVNDGTLTAKYNNTDAFTGTLNTGQTMMVAIDITTQKFWVRDNTQWIPSGDPALGTGGQTYAALGAGDIFPMFSVIRPLYVTSLRGTGNFGATAFVNTKPTGFCSWDDSSCGGPRSRGFIFGANDNWPAVVIKDDRCEIAA